MLKWGFKRKLQLDELYAMLTGSGDIALLGFIGDTPVHPSLFSTSLKDDLLPRCLRVLINLDSSIIVLGLHLGGRSPEVCSPALYDAVFAAPDSFAPVEKMISKIRAAHNVLPDSDMRRFRSVCEKDLAHFGLAYHVVRDRLTHNRKCFEKVEKLLDFGPSNLYSSYIYLSSHHPMGSYFRKLAYQTTTVLDICAALIDPRMLVDYSGRFHYEDLSKVFGFPTFRTMIATALSIECSIDTRPLPYSCQYYEKEPVEIKLSANSILGVRAVCSILRSPLDDLELPLSARTTKRNESVDTQILFVQKYLHWLINDWMKRLDERGQLQVSWIADPFSPELFTEVKSGYAL